MNGLERAPAADALAPPEWARCYEAVCNDLSAIAGNGAASAAAMDRLVVAFIRGNHRDWRNAVKAVDRCLTLGSGCEALAALNRLAAFVRENMDLLD